MAKKFTIEEVRLIIENLLQHPDQVIDYLTNENTSWDEHSLLELVIKKGDKVKIEKE